MTFKEEKADIGAVTSKIIKEKDFDIVKEIYEIVNGNYAHNAKTHYDNNTQYHSTDYTHATHIDASNVYSDMKYIRTPLRRKRSASHM